MKTESFFPGTHRRITIGSPTKQCSNGRIVFPIQMPLTGESFIGMPDWIGAGFNAVRDSFTEVEPETQQVGDLVLAFNNDKPAGELFAPPSAKVPGSELKGFKIVRVGDPDNPNIELQFKAFAPFTRDFWAWIGEMAGKEVYMAFPSSLSGRVVASKGPNLPLEQGDTAEGATEATAGVSEPMPASPTLTEELGPEFESQVRTAMGAKAAGPRMVDARPSGKTRKSGPKDLADFHVKAAGRSRPN
jgi:hypothetical protein